MRPTGTHIIVIKIIIIIIIMVLHQMRLVLLPQAAGFVDSLFDDDTIALLRAKNVINVSVMSKMMNIPKNVHAAISAEEAPLAEVL